VLAWTLDVALVDDLDALDATVVVALADVELAGVELAGVELAGVDLVAGIAVLAIVGAGVEL
jgi:hypothetical protein